MSWAEGAIGAEAIGSIEALASAASAAAFGCDKAGLVRDRLLAAFIRRGAEASVITRLDAAVSDIPVNVLAVWVMTRSEELVGEVRQSDMTVLVHPAAFDTVNFTLPLRKGDRVTRGPGLAREHVHTVLETPAVYTIGAVDILYRLIVRG